MQGEVQCQWTHVVLLLISVQLRLDPKLQGFILNQIKNGFGWPHEILIPQEIAGIQGEVGTGLDDLSRHGMHPVNKKVLDILDISLFLTWSKNADPKHIMGLHLVEFAVQIIVDVQDIEWSQDYTIIVFSNHEVFKVDVLVATSLKQSRNESLIENLPLLII